MLNSPETTIPTTRQDEAANTIVASGPSGALAVAGVATAIVIALWFAFYLFVFSPRAAG